MQQGLNTFKRVRTRAQYELEERHGSRLAIGWIMGTLVSAAGCYFSVYFDLPTGATIVCTFGAALIGMAIVRSLFFKTLKSEADATAVEAREVLGR